MCAKQGRSHLISTPLFIATSPTVRTFQPPLIRRHPQDAATAAGTIKPLSLLNTRNSYSEACSYSMPHAFTCQHSQHSPVKTSATPITRTVTLALSTCTNSCHVSQPLSTHPISICTTFHRFVKKSVKRTVTAFAAIATAFTFCMAPASTATSISQTSAAASQSPTDGMVIFDKDYAALWQDGTANPLSISHQAPSKHRKNDRNNGLGMEQESQQPKEKIMLEEVVIQDPSTNMQRVTPERGVLPSPSLSLEARILSRLLVALVVGGIIGMERRAANSLAGVRTFSLVSLGAAMFMSTTLTAFPTSDPTRIAAAISSSVGFLGAGAMHKNSKHSRGLTTASSVWLAAALGIAAAAGLFLLSFSGAVATVVIARYARFDSSLHLIRGNPLQGAVELDEIHDDTTVLDDEKLPSRSETSVESHEGNGSARSKSDAHVINERRPFDGKHIEDEGDSSIESSNNGSSKR